MTYEEKKSLYESIMLDVARIVKQKLNEAYESGILKKFIEFSKDEAKKQKKYLELILLVDGKAFNVINVKYDGTTFNGIYKNPFSDLSDDNIYGKKYFVGNELDKALKRNSHGFDVIRKMTLDNHLSCVVLVDWAKVKNDRSEDVIAGLFINPKGTEEIYDAIKKTTERGKNKIIQIEKDPKKWTSAEWKDVYARIKDEYGKFKKENGDKTALELSETINDLVADKNFMGYLNKVLQTSVDKKTATKYLYCFLLNVPSLWINNTLRKDDKFMNLFKKFHPDNKD